MSNLKILVVDDAAFIRDMVRKTLRSRFPTFTVEEAVNGRKAQQVLNASDYDLVLCDWEMPEMSGIELLNWFRKEHQKTTPFVMVTSRGDKDNVVEAVQAGVTDYIGKPFSRDKLLSKVVKVLSKHHDLKGVGSSAPQGIAADSIDALTGGSRKAAAAAPKPQPTAAPAFQSTADKAAASNKPVPASRPASTKGKAHLRFADDMCECGIRSLSLKQISVICQASGPLPQILEPVVIDLQQNDSGGDVARINAYVHLIQAAEPSMNSPLVTVGITIIDNDPQKLAYLSKLIARGTASTSFVPGAN